MTWQDIVEIARTKPRDEMFALIDEIITARPELHEAGIRAKQFLDSVYAAVSVGESVTAGMAEILNLVKTGSGPVSNAPEIGLV